MLNYLILLISCLIFIYLCIKQKFSLPSISILTFLLTLNVNTKYFLLTPHFQMFNILCPIIGLYLLDKFNFNNDIKNKKLYFLSFASGFLLLFYSIFINILFFIIICLFLNNKFNKKLIKNIFFISFLFILPSLIFLISLKIIGNNVYVHEAKAANMFVWIMKINFNNVFIILNQFMLEFLKLLMFS